MITLIPGQVRLEQLHAIANTRENVCLEESAYSKIMEGRETVDIIASRGEPAYGINTGFGRLATTHIPHDQLEMLQRNLVLSHAVGVGTPLPDPVVRVLIALKVASLSHGNSGVRVEVIDALITLLNSGVVPEIPSKGSVGASGDLAPLAHLAAVLIGTGWVRAEGERLPAAQGLSIAGLSPLELQAKEGLALLNGTQASTAIALTNLFRIDVLFRTGLVAGAMSLDAAAGSVVPFDHRIHLLRGHKGQILTAAALRTLLENSEINHSHQDCGKVQDPYSLRCQPQVMGAIYDQLRFVAHTLWVEANGVTDNPLVFPDTTEVLSGGNFHAEPVAFASDNAAIAASEIGGLAERRIALLIDSSLSGLPPFLVRDGGVNSGFMIAHVTAAALASENKSHAHPASVDSLPTSANQEDHVSMATYAARRLGDIADNVGAILAIELLASAQGIELRDPLRTSPRLKAVLDLIRVHVPHYEIDHYLAADIEAVAQLVDAGEVAAHCPITPIWDTDLSHA